MRLFKVFQGGCNLAVQGGAILQSRGVQSCNQGGAILQYVFFIILQEGAILHQGGAILHQGGTFLQFLLQT